MNLTDFKAHVQKSTESLPLSVKDVELSLDERKLEALIHLNTIIYPHLKNSMQMKLEICGMKDGPEKLRTAMIWNIAVSQTSAEDLREISKLLDKYLIDATS